MMCWSSWQKNVMKQIGITRADQIAVSQTVILTIDNNTENLWNMLRDNHRSNLENDGPSNTIHCTTRAFPTSLNNPAVIYEDNNLGLFCVYQCPRFGVAYVPPNIYAKQYLAELDLKKPL